MIKLLIFLYLTFFSLCSIPCEIDEYLEHNEENIIHNTIKNLVLYKKPSLPTSLYLKDINQGYVKVTFVVDEEGFAKDIQILDSNPPRLFDKAIIKATKELKFIPASNLQIKNSLLIYRYEPEFGIYLSEYSGNKQGQSLN